MQKPLLYAHWLSRCSAPASNLSIAGNSICQRPQYASDSHSNTSDSNILAILPAVVYLQHSCYCLYFFYLYCFCLFLMSIDVAILYCLLYKIIPLFHTFSPVMLILST
ncbi:hypothetical protein EV426DRAFT_603095 [Tirmania nivea]|nr:hypothetical protein EV426DRAFT_603095 [Tirmania nivea]